VVNSILIIEDLPEVAGWLTKMSQRAFVQASVTVVGSLSEAHSVLMDLTPDLALIDLGLPDGCGLNVLRTLKRSRPQTCCVVTTIFDDAGHLFPALKAGADGYLLKDDDDDEFIFSLEGIVDGRPPLSPSIAQMMLKQFHQPEGDDVHLTSREEDMLVLVANGYSVKDAAASLGISAHTAAGYLKALYQKLKVSNRAEATIKAVSMGLVHPQNPL